MQSKKFGVVFSVGLVVLATAAIAGVKAQQSPAAKAPAPAALPVKSGEKNVQIIDVTPNNMIWPRTHVVYDFERQTVTVLTINMNNPAHGQPIVSIHEIKSLATVDPPTKD